MKLIIFTIILFFPLISFGQMKNQNPEYDKLVDEGLELLKQQSIPAAIAKYEKAYKLDSTRVEANYGLGLTYKYYCQFQGSNCFTALFYLNRAIQIDDSYRNSYYNRGGCKTVTKDYKGAIEDFNKAILQQPKKASYYISRGTTYQALGDNHNACKDLKKAAELNNSTAKQLLITLNCQ